MPTVLDTLQKGTTYLAKYGVEQARLNMQHLIAHVLKCDHMQIYVNFERELDENQLTALRALTKKRANGEPLQHLLGTVEFYDLEFKTDSRALIPRPETEELTEKCIKLPLSDNPRILDLGCGSGVIGISLAHHLAALSPSVVLADISPEALALAEENRSTLAPNASIQLVESDLFSALDGTFDLIVANLPYVPLTDRTSLSREVQRDPDLALYGGESGLEILERFFAEVGEFTKEGSRIALEYGIEQDEAVKKLAENSKFEKIQILRDLSEVNRFLFAVKF